MSAVVRPIYGGRPLACPYCGAEMGEQIERERMHRAPLRLWHMTCSVCRGDWWIAERMRLPRGATGAQMRRWRRMAAAYRRRPRGRGA